MRISVISYSLPAQPPSLAAWEERLFTQLRDLISSGSDVILYPELCLMGLTDYFPGELRQQYRDIAYYLRAQLYPRISDLVRGKDVLLCLGTGPRDEAGKIFNAAPIWVDDTLVFQDKIHLTPWEVDFTPGHTLTYFTYRKLTVACVICFDIEQPGIPLTLKRNGVDLVLVPSATTDRNGSQRVNRCASARSVELGAAVVTAPLVGGNRCELIDHNEGRQGFFLPAQAAVTVDQENFSAYSANEEVVAHYELPDGLPSELKKRDHETKPYFKDDLILP